jgi:hypothetical protein
MRFTFLTAIVLSLFSACDWNGGLSVQTPNLIPATDDMVCERHPNAVIVAERHSTSDNPCEAGAKIQAIAYECGLVTDTAAFVQNSFKMEVEKAREKCDEFCSDQSRACTGFFSPPGDCGLKSPPNLSSDFGKNVIHGPKNCKGQAFNYCSIYHASFFATGDRSLFENMRENCQCRKK